MRAQDFSQCSGRAMARLPARAEQVRTEAVAERLEGPAAILDGIPDSPRRPGGFNWILCRQGLQPLQKQSG